MTSIPPTSAREASALLDLHLQHHPLEIFPRHRYSHGMDKGGTVHIMTNRNNTVLYTGVTSDLEARVSEHKQGLTPGFTKRYKVHKLVYFDDFPDIVSAIAEEKRIKGGPRWRKIALIEEQNPDWLDLAADWYE
jgi:putative endonuclease